LAGRLRRVLDACVLATLLIVPATARAATPTSADCLTCHGNRDLAGVAPKREGSLFVDGATFASSVHAGLSCAGCHADAAEIPHAEKLAPVRCASCHAAVADTLKRGAHGGPGRSGPSCTECHGTHDVRPAASLASDLCSRCHAGVVEDYRLSVHAVGRENGDDNAATCRDCHGSAHAALAQDDPRSPIAHGNIAETCARCHADRQLMIKRRITIPEAAALYTRSVHGRSTNPRAATCNDCHNSHRLLRATNPASSVYRANVPRTCGRCHPAEEKAYEISIHGTALARGVGDSPSCTGCHGEHLIRGPEQAGSPVATGAVTATCSRCHDATGIRETYGLPAGRLSTYEDSFHGLAAKWGSPVVANCASCHGYHDVLPSSDPRSEVSPQRLAETCGKCHPGVGARVLAGPVHLPFTTRANPVLYYVRLIYLLLIVGTIGGMVLHNGLDYAMKLRRHWRRLTGRENPETVHAVTGMQRWFLRMTLSERIQHGLLALSFFTLVYTGFALKFPDGWPFAWFARLEHGYSLRSLVHRIAAVVMVAVSLYHVYYLLTARGRGMLAAMAPRLQDARDLVFNLLYLMGLRATPPAFDRFGYIEKAEYWALIWGTVVMTLTGLILWFTNLSLKWFDRWVLDLATLIHYYEAWLAFLAIVVWHLYQNIANPDVYPMNWTWLSGRIPEEQLRHEHRLEWEREMAREAELESASEPTPGDASEAPDPPDPPGAGHEPRG